MAITVVSIPQATAQFPFVPQIQVPSVITNESDNRVASGWVHLDGRRLFQVSATRANLPERIETIERNLRNITQDFLRSSAAEANVEVRETTDCQ